MLFSNQLLAQEPRKDSGADGLQTFRQLKGEVRSAADGKAIEAVSIHVGSEHSSTDKNGRFNINVNAGEGTIELKHLAFKTKRVAYDPTTTFFTIELEPLENLIEDVEVVSTGYQTISRERAVGAFDHISKEILERQVQPNILERLDGVSNVLFDRRNSSNTLTQIRGVYTLLNETMSPLIILDNFPFEGDISSINPADVESITILKDAAAASIWGTRAGNGVIVITSKTGKGAKGTEINWNSTLSIQQKRDLFGRRIASSSDFVDFESELFDLGYFDDYLSNPYKMPVSETVEILDRTRSGQLSAEESENELNALRRQDVRQDFMDYIYRNASSRQHSLSLMRNNGGSSSRFSVGYNRNISELIGDDDNRLTMRWTQDMQLNRRLKLQLGSLFTGTNRTNNSLGAFGEGEWFDEYAQVIPIYSRLREDDGSSSVMLKRFRKGYTDGLETDRLYDWNYRPLDELQLNDNVSKTQNILADLGLQYLITDGLSLRLSYQFQQQRTVRRDSHVEESYFVRDLVNNYTDLQTTESSSIYPVPQGGILDQVRSDISSHNGRALLDWNRRFGKEHALTAMAGSEWRTSGTVANTARSYGYDRNLNTQRVNYTTRFNRHLLSAATIPYMDDFSETNYRYVSYFGNANYVYRDRYTLFGSFRNDAANIFGVKTRDKWTPLWSVGTSWHVAKEPFYDQGRLPDLKIRTSYGYSGNVLNNRSAYTTLGYYSSATLTLLPYASVLNPSNPDLRWEKVGTLNLGMDMSSERFRFSVDYYRKQSTDVFATQSLDPTTGITTMLTNSADITGNGLELSLNTVNIQRARFSWSSGFLLSYNTFKVTKYLNDNVAKTGYVSDGATIYPYEGFNPYMVVSHRWAGLNPETGAARGIWDGEPSENYAQIIQGTPNEEQVLHGPATPPYFGNLLNTFSYGPWSFSFNLTYKFGYYFRKPSLNYYSAVQFLDYLPSEYADRWQKPGDEQFTDVPAFTYPVNSDASTFYTYSEVNVDRGDHIRLRDLRISYRLPVRINERFAIRSLEVGGYYSGDHLLWKRNRFGLDPDNPKNGKTPSLVALDLKIVF
ncbi:SusC/RagA family TonB-linked outer membrane protein [Sphingobacterium sp. LRF_L2]|uniref:SusC/RagA family TonB-linked outer membrane protein n=1 Tax=Sphingobacterium sp. LRF_L2 TaxID=3369421 RepID=UPI003F6004F3